MRLGVLIRKYRGALDLTLEGVAGEIGIDLATLSRLENGKTVDIRNWMKIQSWLMGSAKKAA